jgi:hypothetical protein
MPIQSMCSMITVAVTLMSSPMVVHDLAPMGTAQRACLHAERQALTSAQTKTTIKASHMARTCTYYMLADRSFIASLLPRSHITASCTYLAPTALTSLACSTYHLECC